MTLSPRMTRQSLYKEDTVDPQTTHGHFPHLLPKEVVIWKHFLRNHGQDYDRYEYDVHVGQGVELPPGASEMSRRISAGLTRKRIDVVGYRGDSITLFEVKANAGVGVVGQLLAYEHLYIEEHPEETSIHLVIITDWMDSDVKSVCQAYLITTHIMNVPWERYEYSKILRRYTWRG